MRARFAAVVALSALLVGVTLIALGRREASPTAARTPSIASINWGAPISSTTTPGEAHQQLPVIEPGRGTAHLTIARLHVNAAITEVTTTDSELQVPVDPRVLGWWSRSARPGGTTGAVVIDGHINYAGVNGALSVLPRTRPGDVVTITQGKAVVRYAIRAVHTYPKSTGLPAAVFRSGGAPGLNLITCGGPFDSSTGNYEDNVVAFATELG